LGERRATRRGFTLVELLVAIAIIAILAAILLPVLGHVRETAKKTVCASNFRQGALAILLYKDDNGERCVPATERGCGMPGYGRWNGPADHDKAWPEIAQRYLKSWRVLRCPADPQSNDEALSIDMWTGKSIPPEETAHRHFEWAFRTHLGLNQDWFSYVQTRPEEAVVNNVRFGSIGAPARTIMLVDSIRDRDEAGVPFGGGSWAVDAPSRPPDIGCYFGGWYCWERLQNGDPFSPECLGRWNAWGGCYPWHGGRTLFTTVYADAHVRANRVSDLLQGVNAFTGEILDLEAFEWDTVR
jgi:prepilin-type N-terminal cleavage/methylation domain-containing protein